MKILIKFPTRSRPQRAFATLEKYVNMADERMLIGILVSCDNDDTSMTNPAVRAKFEQLGTRVAWFRIVYGANKTKIQACNADMDKVDYPWDIVVLASDDMIPQEHGYDSKIRLHMRKAFPDTDGILWFNDGLQNEVLNTLSIMGRKMYEHFGYIYNPVYKGFYCDNEFTDLCKGELRHKCSYMSHCIIQHQHPLGGKSQYDALYYRNQRFFEEDLKVYIQRKKYPYHWSVLIPTIPGREKSLQDLQASIREKMSRICPELTYEIRVEFDNRVMSIGAKREKLLKAALGKYMSFIDDDDEITDAYIEDLRDCIHGNYEVMQLTGIVGDVLFVHTVDMKLTDKMATNTHFQRPPNHLNPMLTDIARWAHFKDAVRGEDLEWAIHTAKIGYLKRQYNTQPGRVHYIYNLKGPRVGKEALKPQQTITPEEMLRQIFIPAASKQPIETQMRLGRHGFVSM